MKNIFITLFALIFSVNAFADSDAQVLRTLHCKGILEGSNKTTKEFSATIKDTKDSYTEGKYKFVDYWSTMTFSDLKVGKGELFGNVASVETGVDVQKHRDSPRDGSWQGLTFYEIFKSEKAAENPENDDGYSNRLGLIIISSTCTTEQLPEAKKCPNPRGKRNYEIAVQYGEQDDKDALVYAGKIECALNSKALAE
jgi:hypothetical protein